jgi:hypothetical protein
VAVYTYIFIAAETDVMTVPLDRNSPVDYFSTVQGKNITSLSLATLEAILAGQPDPYARLEERLDTWEQNAVWMRADGNVSVERFPDTLVSALATLIPEATERAARAWEDTDEVRASGDKAAHAAWLAGYLDQLSALARRALAEGKGMYLWTAV